MDEAPVAAAAGELREVLLGHDREIGADEIHDYQVELAPGEVVSVRLEQRGADVALAHVDPRGEEILRMDRPLGGHGSERLTLVADTGGRHLLRVEAGSAGRYRWTRVDALRRAGSRDYLSAGGEREFMRARGLEKLAQRESSAAALREAEEGYRRAWERFAQAGDRHGEAIAGFRLAVTVEKSGRSAEADASFAQAARELAAAGEREATAQALNWRAEIACRRGDLDEAEEIYRSALALAEAAEFPPASRQAHLGLAWLANSRSSFGEALEHLAAAERDPTALEPGELLTIQSLRSDLYSGAGDPERALSWAEAASAFAATAEDRAGVLQRRGRALHELGRDAEAVALFDAATAELAGPRTITDRASVRFDRGRARMGLGRPEAALVDFESAAKLWRELGDEGQALIADAHAAWCLERRGEIERSVDLHRRTVASFRRRGDPDGEGAALHGLARAELAAGDLVAAHRDVLRSVELLERRRATLTLSGWRLGFIGRKSDRRALLVDVLMQLHERSPAAGHLEEALRTAERARERELGERLFEQRSGLGVAVDAPPDLLVRRREIDEGLRRLEVAAAASEGRPPDPLSHRGLLQLLERDEVLESEFRAVDPRYAALTRPRIPSLAEIAELLGDQTCLLFYALGADRSWLWAIDRDGLRHHPLAGRATIEEAVREAVGAVGSRPTGAGDGTSRAALAALSDLVLAPAVSCLGRHRLAVVADGALHFAPFAALPVPPRASGSGQPLVTGHEIVFVPSLAVLAELRRTAGGDRRAARTLALVADPVSSPDDERLPADRRTGANAGAELGLPGDPEASGLGRLHHARAEAEALLRLVPPGEVFAARDFAATRDLVLAGGLAGARFVHFTGHGFFNEILPTQSGLVFSRFDEAGRPIPGILRVRDVYRLDLPCEMVVLSACESGRGRVVGGEGVVGLTRGFLAAGARRVVVTLWEVDDAASAHLVGAFYRGLLRDGLEPAAALAAAQAEVRDRPGWRDPFYWSGFVLVGDWR